MLKKYFSEHLLYFIVFTIVSLLYIVYGYASLILNDDWALRSMLATHNIYGTLIMSYPLSYMMSHLYDFFPSVSWYSLLLTLVMGVNFYLISIYISKLDSYIQKGVLFVLALLWLTFLWFNMSITTLTVVTMTSAIILIGYNLSLSFLVLFLASLLRTDMMIIFMPFYAVSYFILREKLMVTKRELVSFIVLILLVISSLFIQKQDKQYTRWLAFNKARSAVTDMELIHVKKDSLTKQEVFCIRSSSWHIPEFFDTDKLIAATPTAKEILDKSMLKVDMIHFLKNYRFKHWLWLLIAASLIIILINYNNRKPLFLMLLIAGGLLLIIIRDVDRVIVPMIFIWLFVVFENLKRYRMLSAVILAVFTYYLYYYTAGQLGYRYFYENTALQKEARQLIHKNKKVCEISLIFPTRLTHEVGIIFSSNYLFRENDWLQMNDKEILPGGWLARNKFFYRSYHMSDAYTQREHKTYYDFLIDDDTAFFGSTELSNNPNYKRYLLEYYDKKYLKDKPNCKHKVVVLDTSKHYSITQVQIDCNRTKK